MTLVELTQVKEHVRADEFSDDDNYLTGLAEAAEAAIFRSANRTAEEVEAMADGDKAMLKQAVLMLIGHWYDTREATSTAQMAAVPYTIDFLVKPLRKLVAD